MTRVSFTDPRRLEVRLARTDEEIEAALRLRYHVFTQECGANVHGENGRVTNGATHMNGAGKIDHSPLDDVADHLIVIDHDRPHHKIIATYRLLQQSGAKKAGKFYTSDEYNLEPLKNSGSKLLELARSCVLKEYRTRPVIQLLWQGIADYVSDHDIDLMFGCASFFHVTDPQEIATELSYLHHYHACPPDLTPRAVDKRYIDMNMIPKEDINARRAFAALPALIKGYLRVGATIGDGAVVDIPFNCTDVCIVVQTEHVTERYRKHYERKIQKPLSSRSAKNYSETSGGDSASLN